MSSTARLVITAVVHQNRPVAEVAATYAVHRSWVYRLVRRYEQDGEAALEPRSRRPRTVPRATSAEKVTAILALREELTAAGHDAGPATIAEHLTRRGVTVSVATIWRTLNRHGLITPEPKKRPKASYIRFEASAPNECWQSDFTHVRLAGGTDTEVITWLDDHSRYALSVTAHTVITGQTVTTTFQTTAAEHGLPATVLTDNGLVYTTHSLKARNSFQRLLHKLGIHQKNGAPNHPQTQGKVERFQQTLKKHLATRAPADSIAELQAQIDAFVTYYNHIRPYAAHRCTLSSVNKTSRQRANDRNSVVAFVVGVLLIAAWVVNGVSGAESGFAFPAFLGVVLVILGIYFRGKKYPNGREHPEGNNVTERLRELGDLHQKGVLTDEEFAAKKAELLRRL